MLCDTCMYQKNCTADWLITACASYKLNPFSPSGKDKYLIQFETKKQAQYWMKQFVEKFSNEVLSAKKTDLVVEMPEALYYFYSKRTHIGGLQFAEVYPQEAIYIILDDIERTRLDSYNGDRGIAIYKGDMHVESNSRLF